MELSDKGKALLRELEGCSYVPYRDSAGLLSIGIGHLLTKSELSSGKIRTHGGYYTYKDGPITDATVDALLTQDTHTAVQAVCQAVAVPLWQHQFDSLVCFVFNIGSVAFRGSTLVRLLNADDYASVPGQMFRWIYAGGEIIDGLRIRRGKEVALWKDLRI